MLTLVPGQVDVWTAFVAESFDGNGLPRPHPDVLSAREREQHQRFRFEKDRRRFLVTRLLVRYVLSRYVPLPPEEWTFEATSFGRPLIANDLPAARELTFNISHSEHVVLLGIAHGGELGIDVEDLQRRTSAAVADSFFAADEARQLEGLPAELQSRRFLDLWTLKESYIKARGKGLFMPLNQFAFDLRDENRLTLVLDPSLGDVAQRWSCWQWQPSCDSVAALCVSAGMPVSIRARRVAPFLHEQETHFTALRTSTT